MINSISTLSPLRDASGPRSFGFFWVRCSPACDAVSVAISSPVAMGPSGPVSRARSPTDAPKLRPSLVEDRDSAGENPRNA